LHQKRHRLDRVDNAASYDTNHHNLGLKCWPLLEAKFSQPHLSRNFGNDSKIPIMLKASSCK